jgi:5-methylcytosine-specific restriction endonuclease McrA
VTELRLPKPARRSPKARKPIRSRVTLGAKRRAAKAAGDVDWDSWLELLRFYGGTCAWCEKRPCTQMGHIVALANNGAHHISNVAPVCWPCNSRQGTRTIWPRRRHPFMEEA